MLKKKIIKSTLSLLFVGFITKILSTIGRIATARTIGQESMGIYMLVMPVSVFFINIIQLSLPTCINKLIAQNPTKTKNIIIASSIIALIINSIFMISIISLIVIVPTLAPSKIPVIFSLAKNAINSPASWLSIK